MYNQRLSQRDYWSQDLHLKAETVASVMARDNFETIKSKMKFYEPENQNNADRI